MPAALKRAESGSLPAMPCSRHALWCTRTRVLGVTRKYLRGALTRHPTSARRSSTSSSSSRCWAITPRKSGRHKSSATTRSRESTTATSPSRRSDASGHPDLTANEETHFMTGSDEFDAIVVGSGITGGWAAKELTQKGLKVLMLERGKSVEHGKDYTTEHMPTWRIPNRNLPDRRLYASDYYVQRHARGFDYTTLHFWNNDRLNPYVQVPGKPYNWFRANVVGGRSLMWGRHSYRWSDLDFEANRRDGHGSDWPIRYADTQSWYSYVERFIGVSGRAEGLAQLPDGEFLPP